MNRAQTADLWPVMKAFAEGAHVEMFMPDHSPSGLRLGVWVKVHDPSFDPKWKWRVAETKPKASS